MNANSSWIRSLWEIVPIVGYPEVDPHSGPVPIRLGMFGRSDESVGSSSR